MAMTLEEAANILNVSINATKQKIKRACRKLCMRWHPDKNQDNVETANKNMQLINSAYNLMSSQNPGRDTTHTTQTTQRASRPNTGHKTYYSNSQTHGQKQLKKGEKMFYTHATQGAKTHRIFCRFPQFTHF